MKKEIAIFSLESLSELEIKYVPKSFSIVKQSNWVLLNGVEYFLAKLYSMSFSLFITTKKKDSVIKKFKQIWISDVFDLILGVNKEDHIQAFAKSKELLFEEFSSKAFFCSNFLIDMNIAKKFNIYAIGVTGTFSKEEFIEAGADIVVTEIADIMNLDIF